MGVFDTPFRYWRETGVLWLCAIFNEHAQLKWIHSYTDSMPPHSIHQYEYYVMLWLWGAWFIGLDVNVSRTWLDETTIEREYGDLIPPKEWRLFGPALKLTRISCRGPTLETRISAWNIVSNTFARIETLKLCWNTTGHYCMCELRVKWRQCILL